MDFPGTWEILWLTSRIQPAVPGLNGTRPCGTLHRKGANAERIAWSGAANNISHSVVGTGSLSALKVLLTLGNAVRADPVKGSGAP